MEIQYATRDGCVVVAFTGDIDLLSVPQIQRTLLKDLSDQPFALICDLAGVDTLDPVCARVFSAVANHPASRWSTSCAWRRPRPPRRRPAPSCVRRAGTGGSPAPAPP
jgi:hypothetical protein